MGLEKMKEITNLFATGLLIILFGLGCSSRMPQGGDANSQLKIREDANESTISVFRAGEQKPLVVQNAKSNFRPYLHPIKAPDGNGVLTEFSPGHHTHQTGLYWGFTRVNGRDYFHNPGEDYWKR